MQFFRRHRTSLTLALVELIVGILLLISPTGFTRGILMVSGALLAALGLWSVIRYFRTEAAVAAREQTLARGLAMLLIGLFALLQADWLLGLFPVLTVLYGAASLLTGLYKVQRAVDIRRLGLGSGLMAGISAASTLLFAAIILLNPFATIQALWVFTGLVLIGEALLDILACIQRRKEA